MDNELQIEEIKKFHQLLTNQGKQLDVDNAALIWIKENAEQWRNSHKPQENN